MAELTARGLFPRVKTRSDALVGSAASTSERASRSSRAQVAVPPAERANSLPCLPCLLLNAAAAART